MTGRIGLVIVLLAAMAVGLVHIRRSEMYVRHEIQRLSQQQILLRRKLWDQQVHLGYLTAPATIRSRADEMALGLILRDGYDSPSLKDSVAWRSDFRWGGR